MKYIINIVKRFIHDEKKVLGRWNIENCNSKMNYKIDMSNEDHCGPCGQYNLHNKDGSNTKVDNTKIKDIVKFK